MKENKKLLTPSVLLGAIFCAVFSGCTAMTTLPQSKLQETASAVIGKSVTSVSNVRSVDDAQFFDAKAADGTVYACSLKVVFGLTSQHQKCDKK